MNEEQIKELEGKIQGMKDEISKKFTDIQKANDEGSKERKKALSDITEKELERFEEITKKLEEERKSRLELELLIARKQVESGTDAVLGDPEVKQAFRTALFATGGEMVEKETEAKTMFELAKQYMPHMNDQERDAHVKAMLVGSNPDGGLLCPIELSNKIITRIFETSPMASVANSVNILKGAISYPIDDGEIEALWAGELDTRTETATSKIGSEKIEAHELFAFPKITTKLIQDSDLPMDDFLARKAGAAFGRKFNTSYVTGDGVKQARGFLTLAEQSGSTYERGKVETTTTAGATLDADDLISVQGTLLEDFMPSARWLMNRKLFLDIAKLQDSYGAYLLNPRMLFEGYSPQILGNGVTFMSDMPSSQASNAKAIAFGDWKEAYTIVNRLGISAVKDQITNPGFVKIHFSMRGGGNVTNAQAFKILKIKS